MYRKHIIPLLSILLTVAVAPAYSQDNNMYGFMMLEEPVNPRNIAMGSAGTALGGWGFRYYNPALPFFSGQSHVSIEFGQIPGGLSKGGFESAMVLPDMFTAISLYSNFVDIVTTTEQGKGPTMSSSTTIGAASVGVIRHNLSIGLSLNMADERIPSANYRAIMLGAGLGSKLVDGKLNLGAAMFHHLAWSREFGENRSPWSWGGEQVPSFIRAGVAWTDNLNSFPFTVAADAVYENEGGTIAVPVGLEVNILPSVSLRAGKRIGWNYEVMTMGIGLNIDRISFDAAFVPTRFVDEYELKWSMALTYIMGATQPKKPSPSQIQLELPEPEPEPEVEIIEELLAEEAEEEEPYIEETAEEVLELEEPEVESLESIEESITEEKPLTEKTETTEEAGPEVESPESIEGPTMEEKPLTEETETTELTEEQPAEETESPEPSAEEIESANPTEETESSESTEDSES